MTQAAIDWQQLVDSLQNLTFKQSEVKRLKRLLLPWRGSKRWLTGVTVTGLLLVWNWRLVAATGTGIAAMVLINRMQTWNWHVQREALRKALGSSNRRLTLSIAGGGIATLSAYMAMSIWADTHSHWLATAMILQGMATFAILALLTWQTWDRQSGQTVREFDRLLQDLSHSDPLKRLIAIRQIVYALTHSQLDATHYPILVDAFRLMLGREPEPIVKNAVMDGLRAIDTCRKLNPASGTPFNPAIATRRSNVKTVCSEDRQ